jgi:hypothetical protein
VKEEMGHDEKKEATEAISAKVKKPGVWGGGAAPRKYLLVANLLVPVLIRLAQNC